MEGGRVKGWGRWKEERVREEGWIEGWRVGEMERGEGEGGGRDEESTEKEEQTKCG